MLRAEVFFLNDLELRQAVASLRILADDSRDIVLQAAADFAGKASEAIHTATVELNESPVPKGRRVDSELELLRRSWHCDILSEPSVTDPEARIVILRNLKPKAGR